MIGTLTASANGDLLNIYIDEVLGDLYLNTVQTGPDKVAFISAPVGSIFNGGALHQANVLGGNTLLYRRPLWERSPFADVAVGEDTRFVWSGAGRLSVADDHRFVVGPISLVLSSLRNFFEMPLYPW